MASCDPTTRAYRASRTLGMETREDDRHASGRQYEHTERYDEQENPIVAIHRVCLPADRLSHRASASVR